MVGGSSIFFLILDSAFVAILQVLLVHVAHSVEVGLGTHLVILDILELSLFFLQELNIILVHLVINSIRLIFDIVVGTSVTLESAFHTLHNACLRMDTVIVELPSVVFLGISLKVSQVTHLIKTVALLIVHI